MSEDFKIRTKRKLERRIKKFEKSPLSFFIRKKRVTLLIIIFLFFIGVLNIGSLPREFGPEVEIPVGVVTTAYPGASSLDVEEQITKKIEAKIGSLNNIKEIDSDSGFGLSMVVVEFEAGSGLKSSLRDLKDKLDEVRSDLPEDAVDPQVIEINLNNQPILEFSLKGKSYDKLELKEFAEAIKDELEKIANVNEVKVIGGEKKEIKVSVSPDKLQKFSLNFDDVIRTINSFNLDFPIGSLDIDNFNYGIRVQNKFENVEEVANLVIGFENEVAIRIEDVAEVEESFQEKTTISRISIGGQKAQDTVSVQVFKKTGGNITKIAEDAKKKVAEQKGSLYPEDLQIEVTSDTAKYIDKSINDLSQNGLGTIAIILVLLMLFLGAREAFIASLSIPFAFFIAFVVMAFLGQSLNFITIFSLVLALGLLVDSAIVIVEGMHERIAKYKMSGYSAAMLSVKEYAAPLLSGMLTTISVFLPLLFIGGVFGEFLKGIPIVVIATLIAALFVSLSIIPTVGSFCLKPKFEFVLKNRGIWRFFNFASVFFKTISDKYKSSLRKIISNKQNRRFLVGGAWFLFLLSLILPISGYLKIQAFGESEAENFWINFTMPEGTNLEETDKVVRVIEDKLYAIPEIKNFTTSVGSSADINYGTGSASSNAGTIAVNLVEDKYRVKGSSQLAEEVRNLLQPITQGKIEVVESNIGPPAGSPLEARITGPELSKLEEISNDMRVIMEKIPGAEDVKTDINYLPGNFVITFNPDILAEYRLTPAQIATELRKGISGNREAKISQEGNETLINISYPESRIKNINELTEISFASPLGEKVTLGEIADVEIKSSLNSIKRTNQERSVSLSGRNAKGANINEIMGEFKNQMKDYNLPVGYSLGYGGISQEQNEVYRDMFLKMIIGIILIFFILVAQFNSFRQVLIILFTIPLGIIGVLWGMTLANLVLDIPAFIGIIALSGIVVNNAIILIDRINKARKESEESLVEIVVRTAHGRLKPIILTTATTIMGLLPLSIREPDWRNMGFTIIFGLTFASLVTVFMIPSLYIIFSGDKRKSKN